MSKSKHGGANEDDTEVVWLRARVIALEAQLARLAPRPAAAAGGSQGDTP